MEKQAYELPECDRLVLVGEGVELNCLAHCIGCLATDKLALFAHRIEGQMVGWIFACPNCAIDVSRLRLTSNFTVRQSHEFGGDT